MEGIRIQGQTRRPATQATSNWSLPSAARLVDVVCSHVAGLRLHRASLVHHFHSETSAKRSPHAEVAQKDSVSSRAKIDSRASVSISVGQHSSALPNGPLVDPFAP